MTLTSTNRRAGDAAVRQELFKHEKPATNSRTDFAAQDLSDTVTAARAVYAAPVTDHHH